MYTLIALKNESQAEYLNMALRRYGLNSFVFNYGPDAEGGEIFSISCFNMSELKRARHLIYSSRTFIGDIHPDAAVTLRAIREENEEIFFSFFKLKPVAIVSALALAAALLGYVLDL